MSNCDKFCIPQSEYNPDLHEIVSTHNNSSACAVACNCESSSSSANCHFIECGGTLVHADCGLAPGSNLVVDCEQCTCVEASSSSSNVSQSSGTIYDVQLLGACACIVPLALLNNETETFPSSYIRFDVDMSEETTIVSHYSYKVEHQILGQSAWSSNYFAIGDLVLGGTAGAGVPLPAFHVNANFTGAPNPVTLKFRIRLTRQIMVNNQYLYVATDWVETNYITVASTEAGRSPLCSTYDRPPGGLVCASSSAAPISSSSSVNVEAMWLAQIDNAYTASYIDYCTSPQGSVGPTPYPDATYVNNNKPEWNFLADPTNTDMASINVGYETICGVNSKLAIRMSFFGLPVRGFVYLSPLDSGSGAAYLYSTIATYYTYPNGISGNLATGTHTALMGASERVVYFNQDMSPVIGGYVEFLTDAPHPTLNTTDPKKIFLGLRRLRPIF